MEQKLKYQIDKLLKAVTVAESGKGSGEAANGGADPLSFKPNPRAMMSDVQDMDVDSKEPELYRPPKLAAVQVRSLSKMLTLYVW